jgi:hypothetical protein
MGSPTAAAHLDSEIESEFGDQIEIVLVTGHAAPRVGPNGNCQSRNRRCSRRRLERKIPCFIRKRDFFQPSCVYLTPASRGTTRRLPPPLARCGVFQSQILLFSPKSAGRAPCLASAAGTTARHEQANKTTTRPPSRRHATQGTKRARALSAMSVRSELHHDSLDVLTARTFEGTEIETRVLWLNARQIHLRRAFWARRPYINLRIFKRVFRKGTTRSLTATSGGVAEGLCGAGLEGFGGRERDLLSERCQFLGLLGQNLKLLSCMFGR